MGKEVIMILRSRKQKWDRFWFGSKSGVRVISGSLSGSCGRSLSGSGFKSWNGSGSGSKVRFISRSLGKL